MPCADARRCRQDRHEAGAGAGPRNCHRKEGHRRDRSDRRLCGHHRHHAGQQRHDGEHDRAQPGLHPAGGLPGCHRRTQSCGDVAAGHGIHYRCGPECRLGLLASVGVLISPATTWFLARWTGPPTVKPMTAAPDAPIEPTPESRSGSVPVVAVLVSSEAGRPGHLDSLDGRVDWRFTEAPGLGDAVHGADALLLWDFFSSALAEVWQRCDSLRWVHVAAAGVDTLLFEELRDSEVVVTNARGTFDRAIAEFVVASVLAHAKLVYESRDLQSRRQWCPRETETLLGKRALVVGTGAIGREITRLLQALGLEVRGAGSRSRSDDPDFGEVVDSARLCEHVGDVDYLVNAAPLTPATRGLIDETVFAAIKPGAHLVNIGRGPTVVEADLLAALRRPDGTGGRLDGASLDVFETEPLPADSPLWDAPGVIVSPHMSGDVLGWRDALARQFVDNAQRWLDGRDLRNVVDKRLGYVPSGELPSG